MAIINAAGAGVVDDVSATSWPWPGDSALDRARRIANSLLALLPDDERAQHVATAHRYGETWLGEASVLEGPDDPVTTERAAEIAHVSQDVIRQWACMPHPDDPGRPLLPRWRRRGRQMTYLAGEVRAAMAVVDRAKRQRATG